MIDFNPPRPMNTPTPTDDDILGEIKMTATFVPWKQSHNANEKDPSINWIITLQRNRYTMANIEYMQGRGHLPGYKFNMRETIAERGDTVFGCQRGRYKGRKVQPPAKDEVLHALMDATPEVALLLDATVIDNGCFEDWASEFGYDTDSRKAEQIYQACMKTALELRQLLGDSNINILRNHLQDLQATS